MNWSLRSKLCLKLYSELYAVRLLLSPHTFLNKNLQKSATNIPFIAQKIFFCEIFVDFCP